MFCDRVTCFTAEDIVESGLRAAFITQTQKVLQWINNPPTCVQVDRDVELVLGRHIRGTAVPFQDPFVDRVDHLDERDLYLQAGGGDGFAHRFAKLRDDHLLYFADGIKGIHQQESDNGQEYQAAIFS